MMAGRGWDVRRVPHKSRLEGETRAQRKRRCIMMLVHSVVVVNEQLTSNTILRRMIGRHGSGHHSLPKNSNALAQTLKGDTTFKKISFDSGHNEWRRIE